MNSISRVKFAVLAVLCLCGNSVFAEPGVGQWSAEKSWSFQAIHTVLMKNGKVLCIDKNQPKGYGVYDPLADSFTDIVGPNVPGENPPLEMTLYCCGQAQLADGRIVFVGGGGGGYDDSHAHTVICNPDAYDTSLHDKQRMLRIFHHLRHE